MIHNDLAKNKNLGRFIHEFTEITGLTPEFDFKYQKSLVPYTAYISTKKLINLEERRESFLSLVNKKFELNAEAIGNLYAQAANLGYTFNFHQKNDIQRSFDSNDLKLLNKIFKGRGIKEDDARILRQLFDPVSQQATLNHIKTECENPSKLRIDQKGRNIKNEILEALFSAFLWGSLPTEQMHSYFDPHYSKEVYKESFWDQLHARTVGLFNRNNTLTVIKIDHETISTYDLESIRNACLNLIAPVYDNLNNFGYFAVVIEKLEIGSKQIQWELSSDLILAGEKFKEKTLEKNFFQWKKIKEDTIKYVGHIEDNDARFDLVNEGFIYKDTFVLTTKEGSVDKLLLLFQKNERDETLILCPACRSEEVQGNSYSSLGVRSWECNNVLCPDRTKYNRGKRYSFRNILMQQAIEDERNTIPTESVRRWRRDVVVDVNEDEILDMLIRHYSMYGDTVHIYNWSRKFIDNLGRNLNYHNLILNTEKNGFFSSHLFNRFAIPTNKENAELKNLGDDKFKLYQGDAAKILRSIKKNTFDGAVTSPPYYNAREYSQWANMYCYLFDMFDINKQVFNTLKEGGVYLYNIFDYFDNEKTVALSAMGQKRMILSAYTVDLFRRMGFEVLGNVVWDKGDIEGKRGFNAGNFSPFYQAPFNCWEHTLIFQKPTKTINISDLGKKILNFSKKVFFCKPVHKMVKGENTHGHTAPFPEELPRIITSLLPKNSLILDPFGGSMTTGRVAEKDGISSVSIELSKEYCNLGLLKRNK